MYVSVLHTRGNGDVTAKHAETYRERGVNGGWRLHDRSCSEGCKGVGSNASRRERERESWGADRTAFSTTTVASRSGKLRGKGRTYYGRTTENPKRSACILHGLATVAVRSCEYCDPSGHWTSTKRK